MLLSRGRGHAAGYGASLSSKGHSSGGALAHGSRRRACLGRRRRRSPSGTSHGSCGGSATVRERVRGARERGVRSNAYLFNSAGRRHSSLAKNTVREGYGQRPCKLSDSLIEVGDSASGARSSTAKTLAHAGQQERKAEAADGPTGTCNLQLGADAVWERVDCELTSWDSPRWILCCQYWRTCGWPRLLDSRQAAADRMAGDVAAGRRARPSNPVRRENEPTAVRAP